MIEAIGSNPLGGVLDDIQRRIAEFWIGLWSPISDAWPLWWSYGVVVSIVLAALFLGVLLRLYLPSDWTKFPLLTIFVGILASFAWLFGRVTMYNEMKKKLDAERKKKPVVKPKEPVRPGGGWFQ